MADKSLLHCPHCGQTSKLIPIKSDIAQAGAPAGVFQSVASSFAADDITEAVTVERKSFWASEGVNDAIRGLAAAGIIVGYGWYAGIEAAGTIAAGAALAAVVGFPVLKLWWHRPGRPAAPGAKEKTVKLKVESQEGHTIYRDEITDRNTIEQLSNLGDALVKHPELKDNFSKAKIRKYCGIGGRRYDAIKAELERLNFCFVKPNNRTVITPRCQALLRKHATIPH